MWQLGSAMRHEERQPSGWRVTEGRPDPEPSAYHPSSTACPPPTALLPSRPVPPKNRRPSYADPLSPPPALTHLRPTPLLRQPRRQDRPLRVPLPRQNSHASTSPLRFIRERGQRGAHDACRTSATTRVFAAQALRLRPSPDVPPVPGLQPPPNGHYALRDRLV